ncbi:MAG: N-acetylmuramoyl-L-alanine amidase [Pseudomonadota bacterium]
MLALAMTALGGIGHNRVLAQGVAIVEAVSLSGDQSRTAIEIRLNQPADATIFTLANPYRLIVDAANVAFRLPPGAGRRGGGLVSGFRYGMLAPGRSRIVFDLKGPIDVRQHVAAARTASQPPAIKLSLTAVTAAEFSAVSKGRQRISLRPSTFHAPRRRPQVRSAKRPVIVIDPGHGGADPGAISSSGLREKDVVLAVAKKLLSELRRTKRFRVVSTRNIDKFVALDARNQLAAEVGADLFVSLHADSVGNRATAALVRGATIYTLSERASDENAKALADKENAADLAGGLDVVAAREPETVRSILFDLVRRETANEAAEFRETLIRMLAQRISLSRSPRRSAAFRVLKQLSTPAVLVELGYMSNRKDQALMRTTVWQSKVAAAIAAAISNHFR